MEIPAFLNRNLNKGQNTMTPPAPVKAPKKKRQDALIANIRVTIPINLSDETSVPNATKAVNAVKDGLPAGATVKIETSLGKV